MRDARWGYGVDPYAIAPVLGPLPTPPPAGRKAPVIAGAMQLAPASKAQCAVAIGLFTVTAASDLTFMLGIGEAAKLGIFAWGLSRETVILAGNEVTRHLASGTLAEANGLLAQVPGAVGRTVGESAEDGALIGALTTRAGFDFSLWELIPGYGSFQAGKRAAKACGI